MHSWQFTHRSNVDSYQMDVSDGVTTITSNQNATANQTAGAKIVLDLKQYAGKRVKLSGELSTESATDLGAGLWLTASTTQWHVTDAMYDRLLQGNNDWQNIELVIDVPSDTQYMSCGTWIVGRGTSRVRNIEVQIVDESVPVTASEIRQNRPSQQEN